MKNIFKILLFIFLSSLFSSCVHQSGGQSFHNYKNQQNKKFERNRSLDREFELKRKARRYEMELEELDNDIQELESNLSETDKIEENIEADINSDMINISEAKASCIDIGFKEGTEKFGECVLELTK